MNVGARWASAQLLFFCRVPFLAIHVYVCVCEWCVCPIAGSLISIQEKAERGESGGRLYGRSPHSQDWFSSLSLSLTRVLSPGYWVGTAQYYISTEGQHTAHTHTHTHTSSALTHTHTHPHTHLDIYCPEHILITHMCVCVCVCVCECVCIGLNCYEMWVYYIYLS